MLTALTVRNLAIVDHIDLEFNSGMTVMTGETGAGKSILLTALGLLLGDRAEGDLLRPGATQAELCAHFDLTHLPRAQQWLHAQALDTDEGECLLRRVLPARGRSRAWINGSAQPLQPLRELGELLVEIHGQHQHQSLLQREAQQWLLDETSGLLPQRREVEAAWHTWQDCRRQLRDFDAQRQRTEERRELLDFQLAELEQLDPKVDELEALEQEHLRLANASRLLELSQHVQDLLGHDDQGCTVLMARAQQALNALCRIDAQQDSLLAMLDTARIQLNELNQALERYCTDIELDPARLEWVERRLGEFERLARRHNTSGHALPQWLTTLRDERTRLDQGAQQRIAFETAARRAEAHYHDLAHALSAARAAAAPTLAEQVCQRIRQLGMPRGEFEVALVPHHGHAQGLEHIEFRVSTNPGQALRPLASVVSGGELSRISLVLRTLAASSSGVATLVFDEVDTGISGAVAEVVGRHLRQLGQHCQVLCITHLAQVAAQGHQHLHVRKEMDDHSTTTHLEVLNEAQRIQELARLLGGVEIGESGQQHARDLLRQAQEASQR